MILTELWDFEIIPLKILSAQFLQNPWSILMKLCRIEIDLILFWFDDFWRNYGTLKYLHFKFCWHGFFKTLGLILMKLRRVDKYNALLCTDQSRSSLMAFDKNYGIWNISFEKNFCVVSSKHLGHILMNLCRID